MGDSTTGPPTPEPPDSTRLRDLRLAAETEARTHTLLIRTVRSGGILSALMRPAFLVKTPKGYGILTTTGRKTGKPRPKCVRVIRRGDRAYLVQLLPPHVAMQRPGARTGWLLNILANPNIRIRLSDGTFDGVAREITHSTELVIARTILCETVVPLDYGECAIHRRGRPTRAKIQHLHRYWFDTGHPIVIELATH
ncbi:nitroreductase/quinone reductase family protein [Nocardia altamirensis]|uniref:nitroreductase/quinone reductase family protein n=1 Tax=Nocardia altamirensis TaxID=472158 RepID=UPI000A06D9E2|nr:nitroreductase/quinone reductase family protein [Nocardia altamirensis]